MSSDDHRFEPLCAAIAARDEDQALAVVSENDNLAELFLEMGGVKVFGGHVSYKGQHLPTNYLANRILEFKNQGLDITVLTKFLDQAMANPDPRAANDLFRWCEANNYPLDEHGRIIAYKVVTSEFRDHYTGTFDNSPGRRPSMPRENCDPDPNRTCSRGLHFCSAAYLPSYGNWYGSDRSKVILLAISPTNVVAFPTDYGLSKGRCCGYEVLQEIDADTASSFFEDKGPVYTAPAADNDEAEDVNVRADRTLAEAAGYWVIHIPGVYLEHQVLFQDVSLGFYYDSGEAWDFAVRHAIVNKRAFYQQRVDRLNTILDLPVETKLPEIEELLGITAPKRGFLQPPKAWLEARLAACEAKA